MTYKTVTVDVDVDIDIDEFETDELIQEMKDRGYTCIRSDGGANFDREDWQFLLEMLDKTDETCYTCRIRDKIFQARYG